MEFAKIICPYCGVGCNIELMIENGKAIKTVVKGRNPQVNKNFICIKGLTVHELLNHPQRLKKPLIKEGKEFQEISWKEAFSIISDKFNDLLEKYGNKSIGLLCSGKILNEEAYLAQKFERVVIGNNNIDTCARLCHSPSEVGLKRLFGYGAVSIWWPDFMETDVVMLIGANTKATHPGVWNILKRRKFSLIVANPCDIGLKADISIHPRPGTDAVWINGLARMLYKIGAYDEDFINERTIGFRSYIKSLEIYTPEFVERVSGVSKEELEKIANLMAGKRTIFVWGMGLTQHTNGTKNVLSIGNLALLTGNIGKPGAGVAPLRGQNNVQGAVDMGASPFSLPGHYSILDKDALIHFEGFWEKRLSREIGLSATEMIHAILDGKIRGLYVIGENPAVSEPQSSFVNWMLQKLDFLVVQDIFMTETAKLANVVLPAALIGEKEGTVTNAARRIQFTEKGVNPPGDAMEDWKIITGIANKMGFNWNYRNAEDIWNEVREIAPIFAGASYKRLKNSLGIFWPVYSEEHEGTKRLYENGFAFPDRRARFIPVEPPKNIVKRTQEYPYIMITGRLYAHFNTGEMSRRSKFLMAAEKSPFISLNEEDAIEEGIKDGDVVRVISPYGNVECTVRRRKDIHPPRGYIFAPIHFFNECNFNKLTSTLPLDEEARMPPLKVIPVRLEKVS